MDACNKPHRHPLAVFGRTFGPLGLAVRQAFRPIHLEPIGQAVHRAFRPLHLDKIRLRLDKVRSRLRQRGVERIRNKLTADELPRLKPERPQAIGSCPSCSEIGKMPTLAEDFQSPIGVQHHEFALASLFVPLLITLLLLLLPLLWWRRRRQSNNGPTSGEVLRLSHKSGQRARSTLAELVFVGDRGVGKTELIREVAKHSPQGLIHDSDEPQPVEAGESVAAGEYVAEGESVTARLGVIVWSAAASCVGMYEQIEKEDMGAYARRWSRLLRRELGWKVPIVLVCTKSDLCPVPLPQIRLLERLGIHCLTVSARLGTNMSHLWQLFAHRLPPTWLLLQSQQHVHPDS